MLYNRKVEVLAGDAGLTLPKHQKTTGEIEMKFIPYLKNIILTAIILTANGAIAVEYFPSEPGLQFVYSNFPLVIHATDTGGFMRVNCPECEIISYTTFIEGSSGNIFLQSFGSVSSAGPDPDETYFEPDLKYLDFPLEPSKTWSSTATQFDLWGGEEDTITLTGSVLGTEVVSVPAGEFEVLVVALEFEYEALYWLNHTEVLWLHSQLGPVKDLVSWTGIVSTENASWGTVKALYR